MDKKTREVFRFQQAPNLLLAKSIFDLCKKPKKAGECLLQLCDSLSDSALGKQQSILLMENLVQYAKICFLRDLDGHSMLPLCDTIISRIDILKQVAYKNCHVDISLTDLNVQSKARLIRDQLIHEDQMDLALNICTRCQLETEPVWVDWGLALLKLGNYERAREKFKYCSSLPAQQKQSLLHQILQVIEGAPSIKEIVDYASSDKAKQPAQLPQLPNAQALWAEDSLDDDQDLKLQKSNTKRPPVIHFKSHLSELRIKEAQYYLKLFGSDALVVAFMVRHGELEKACEYIFEKTLPAQYFVDTIVAYCYSHRMMSFVQQVFKSVDSSLQKVAPYILATCKYLSDQEAFNLLYNMQVFMGDELRAGLTCIRLFMKAGPEIDARLALLESAKKHFIAGMMNNCKIAGKKPLQDDEIAKYIKTITLQTEVTKSYGPQQQTGLPTLFDVLKKKCEVTEILLLHNTKQFDLAYRIINEFRLPSVKLYTRVVSEMIKKKMTAALNDMLKNIKGTLLSDADWDAIVITAVNTYALDMNDPETGEKMISKIVDDSKKVRACLTCQKFRAAYLIAVKCNNASDVQFILDYLLSMPTKVGGPVIEHCQRYLQKK